jgi:uncharacterized protein with PQ loop repeat
MGFLLSSTLVYGMLISSFQYSEAPVRIFAYILSYFACIVVLFQYFPQIYKTWSSKSIGSLSIMSMCIQTPGALMIVRAQILQPNSDYTSWLPTLAAAILQGMLLLMCLYLKFICKHQPNLEEMPPATPLPSKNFQKHADFMPKEDPALFDGHIAIHALIPSISESQHSSTSELLSGTDDPGLLEVKPLIKR